MKSVEIKPKGINNVEAAIIDYLDDNRNQLIDFKKIGEKLGLSYIVVGATIERLRSIGILVIAGGDDYSDDYCVGVLETSQPITINPVSFFELGKADIENSTKLTGLEIDDVIVAWCNALGITDQHDIDQITANVIG